MRKTAKVSRCPTCGAPTKTNKHSLGLGLVKVLQKLIDHADEFGGFHVARCDLELTGRQNLYKLKYWGLITKQGDPTGHGGMWRVSSIGMDFAHGAIPLQKSARTYRDRVVKFEGPMVYIGQVWEAWRDRPDYARDQEAFLAASQGGLF